MSDFIIKPDFHLFYVILQVDSGKYLCKFLFYLLIEKAETFTSILKLLKDETLKISALYLNFFKKKATKSGLWGSEGMWGSEC